MLLYETLILGAGAAGMGPLVWAARNGLLGQWLDRGVAVVDRCAAMGGSIGQYALNADSYGASFLECLDGPHCEPLLVNLRAAPTTRELEPFRSTRPPLELVGRFMRNVGASVSAEVDRNRHSRFLSCAEVRAVRLQDDGSVIAEISTADGQILTLRAASAVIALGGEPVTRWRNIELAPELPLSRWQDKIITSDELLSDSGGRCAALSLSRRNGVRVVVLGGSHSAFSAAWAMLERAPGLRFGAAGVRILYRNKPRIFYPSADAATDDGYSFHTDDVCLSTGRINRLSGLRGDGRDLWRRMHGKSNVAGEDRAVARSLASMGVGEIVELLDEADVIVPALGYRLTTVPIVDADGRLVRLARSGPAVGTDARLLTDTHQALAGVFGIGLGSGFVPWGSMSGEPSFRGQQNSMWLYQNGLGALVYEGIVKHAARLKRRGDTTLDMSQHQSYVVAGK
jgi:hypothetical protein